MSTALLSAVKASNDAHRLWAQRRLLQVLPGVAGQTVAVWGLTYKPGTDTLRRSASVDLCRWLHDRGAIVRAHDPAVKQPPPDLAACARLTTSPLEAVMGASALIVATPWPDYLSVSPGDVAARMTRRVVLDAGRFLGDTLGRADGFEYLSVGIPSRASRTSP